MSQENWTPLKIVKATSDYFAGQGVGEARLDAELLLADVLGIERIGLYTEFDRILSADEVDRYREMVRERAAGRPAKYITGRSEFYSIGLAVDERALIPRPETELLVEHGLEIVRERAGGEFPLVVDLCTGTGAIAIAMAVTFPDASYIATDSSPGAVDLARSNATACGARDRIEFLIGDLFEPLVTMGLEGKVDLIVTNPPYVSDAEWRELPREIREHEPRQALAAGPRGTEVQERILEGAVAFLRDSGVLLMEMDDSQRDALEEAAGRVEEYAAAKFHADYQRLLRVVEVGRKR